MRILPFTDESLTEALAILSGGGVIAHATETCYGFACDVSNIDAVKKLFAIKRRPATQPVSALFASIDEAKKFVVWTNRADELAKQYLPGPLTLILPMREDAPKTLFPTPFSPTPNLSPVGGGEALAERGVGVAVGIRISSHPHAQLLVERFGSPLSTTSANLHGQPNPYCAEDINEQFNNSNNQPDLILDSGILPPTPPSTVINLADEAAGPLRQGAVIL